MVCNMNFTQTHTVTCLLSNILRLFDLFSSQLEVQLSALALCLLLLYQPQPDNTENLYQQMLPTV